MVRSSETLRLLQTFSFSSLYQRLYAGQDPLVPADSQNRQIPFIDDPTFRRLPSGLQALVTTYTFTACGNITMWQTYLQPGIGTSRYLLRFQVWRRDTRPDRGTTYYIVGENSYSTANNRLDVRFSSLFNSGVIASANRITVQPGDVVGYFTVSLETDRDTAEEGILLDSSYSDEIVWYRTIFEDFDTPKQLTVGEGGDLNRGVRAAPVLSVDVCEL